MTHTVFVSIQSVIKEELPGQFHLWLRHVFTWLSPFHLCNNLTTNFKSTPAASLQKTSPSLSVNDGKRKMKPWRQSDRVWSKNRTDNTKGHRTAQHSPKSPSIAFRTLPAFGRSNVPAGYTVARCDTETDSITLWAVHPQSYVK